MLRASGAGSALRWVVLALAVIGCDSAPGEVSGPLDAAWAPFDANRPSLPDAASAPDAKLGPPADTAPLKPDSGFDSRALSCAAPEASPRSWVPSAQPVPKDAILVVGNAADLTTAENALIQILMSELHFDAVFLADDNDDPRNFESGLVIITSSVNASTLADNWANQRVPIVVLNQEVFPSMGVSGQFGGLMLGDFNGLAVVQPDHPILQSVPDPCNLRLIEGDQSVSFAVLQRPEAAILRVTGGRGEALLFGFEAGDPATSVDNQDVPYFRHRRFGFFTGEAGIAHLLDDGALLLRNTLLYAWSGSIANR